MAFTRELQVHAMIDGAMVDLTSDVRQEDGIVYTLGGMDEQRRPVPSHADLVFKNQHRNYSPRNPTSLYYKKLGTNTPIFVRLLVARDEFADTVADSWGSAEAMGIRDTAYAWTNTGGVAGDFDVAAGAGTHLISAANSFRYSALEDVSYEDYGVLVECTVAVNDVTGGAIEPANILLRGNGTDYLMVRVSISTAEVLTVALMDESSNVLEAAVTVTGVVDAVSSKTISVRAECENEIVRVRVWKTSESEPPEWHLDTEDRTYLSAGWVGVRSGLAASNSNTPVTFSYNRIEVYSMQFAGEVAKWPPTRDRGGTVRTVAIEAWDLFQRLRQGDAPLKSAIRRGILGSSNVVAYWPCEDGSNSTVVASDSDAAPMGLVGEPSFATNDAFACSDDLLELSGAALYGVVPMYTPTSGQSQIRMLLHVPAAGDTNGEKILRLWTTGGTTGFWDLLYGTGGTITLNVYDPAGSLLYTSGAVAFTLDGRAVRLSLELTQDGADIDWAISTLEAIPGAGAGGTSGTLAGRTYGRMDWINIGGDALFTGTAVGHITVENVVNSVFSLLSELVAFVGEAAEARVLRLAREEGVTAWVGTGSPDGMYMGAQRPQKLLDLIEECPGSDLGGLGPCRGQVAINYRRLNYFYNQDPSVSLSLSGNQLSAFTPEDDNFLLRNDITVKRIDGSEYRATLTSGRLAAVDPIDGGVGVYDDGPQVSLESDAVLPDQAGYRLLQGTVDQPRFPELPVNLGTPAVRADESLTRALIDLDLWRRVQVSGAAEADLYDTVDLLTAGLTIKLNRFEHTITANCVPYDPYRILTLDADDESAVLDLDGSTLAEDLDTTETGVDVAVAGPVLWSTDAADYPLALDVGGERMTASACATETFTFVAAGAASHGDNADLSPALPAGLAEGDILIGLAAIRNTSAFPSGASGGYDWMYFDSGHVRLFWKVAGASESSPTVSFAGGSAGDTTSAVMFAFRGEVAALPVVTAALQASLSTNASAANIAYPSMVIDQGNSVVLVVGWKQDDWTSVATLAGMSEAVDVSSTTGNDQGLVVDYVIQTTPANLAAGSFTVTGGASAVSKGIVLVFRSDRQTFTVTRSVNDVVKSHSTGDEVLAVPPFYVAGW